MFEPSTLLANAYYGFSPAANLADVVCTANRQITACPEIPTFFLGFGMLFLVALCLLIVVSQWKIYKKAGQPGWASIVPIYNYVVMLQIIKKPLWWIVLFFIPFVNAVMAIVLVYNIAKVFGKGIGFTLGMIFLPFIFYPILAFGDAVYTPPAEPVRA
jgi:hypothetical protein